MKIKIVLITLYMSAVFSFVTAQTDNEIWSNTEKSYYNTLKSFCDYLITNNNLSKDILFNKFIEFDYVLKDTSLARIERRKVVFDTLLLRLHRFIDSVGVENLDAKPLRFYSPDHAIRKPFEKELSIISNEIFVYYKKGDENIPIGTIWFDKRSGRIISWILINQGEYHYYLTFSLL